MTVVKIAEATVSIYSQPRSALRPASQSTTMRLNLIYYAVVKCKIINVSNSMFCTVHVFHNSAQNMEMHEIWSFGSQENHLICCHQMSDFKAKMHQYVLW